MQPVYTSLFMPSNKAIHFDIVGLYFLILWRHLLYLVRFICRLRLSDIVLGLYFHSGFDGIPWRCNSDCGYPKWLSFHLFLPPDAKETQWWCKINKGGRESRFQSSRQHKINQPQMHVACFTYILEGLLQKAMST